MCQEVVGKHLIKEIHILCSWYIAPNMESVASQMITDIVIDCNDNSNPSQPQRKASNSSQNSRTRIQTSIQQIKQNQRNIVIF